MCLEEWGVVDSALQEMRWTHERAEGKGGIGSCSPLLRRMEYLLPGLPSPEPRSTAASMGPSREAKFQHNGQ